VRQSLSFAILVALCLSPGTVSAQHGAVQRDHAAHAAMANPSQAPRSAEAEGPKAEVVGPRELTTTQSIEIAGGTLRYRTVAGEIHLDGEDGEPDASIFSTAYFKIDLVNNPEERPITFVFNGGPGSSSVWLHLGVFGPKVIDLGPDPLEIGAPPYPLRPNPDTLLKYTDLVFVDPVGTGWSRAIGEHEDADFWGVDEDSASMARFIRAFLTKHGRWRSPRYLAGESYGTIRATLLLRDLSLETLNGVAFNGVILISPAMDVRLFLGGAPGHELPWVTHLPTFAATALYHGRLPEEPTNLEAFLDEAREFASTRYLTALFRGHSLSETEREEIASELHRFTGLSEEFLLRSDLRVNPRRFLKELLRDEGKTLAAHDTRFQGSDPDDVEATHESHGQLRRVSQHDAVPGGGRRRKSRSPDLRSNRASRPDDIVLRRRVPVRPERNRCRSADPKELRRRAHDVPQPRDAGRDDGGHRRVSRAPTVGHAIKDTVTRGLQRLVDDETVGDLGTPVDLRPDRDARAVAGSLGVQVSRTLGVLLHLVEIGAFPLVEADVLLTEMSQAGYRSPVTCLAEIS